MTFLKVLVNLSATVFDKEQVYIVCFIFESVIHFLGQYPNQLLIINIIKIQSKFLLQISWIIIVTVLIVVSAHWVLLNVKAIID